MMLEKENGQVRLDDPTLEKHAASYPEAMREPVMWLGWYLREECARDLDVLVANLKEFGIEHDKTTWSKILRGRWNRDAAGNIVENVCLALPKFLKAIEQLKKDQELKELAGQVPFVMTPTAQSMWNYVEARMAPGRVNKFGVIAGHTGTQKTATLKQFRREHNHGLCTLQEAPENGSLREFVVAWAEKYGHGKSDSFQRGREKLWATVKSKHCIMVDNAQTLYRPKQGTDQPVFNLLRRLQDEKGCTIILSITPEFHRRLLGDMMQGYFEQFEGRAGGRRNFLILPDYPLEEDVLAIAQAFKLKDADKHVDYLQRIVHESGRIRILFEDLQMAKVEAEREKRQLTIGHVKEARGED